MPRFSRLFSNKLVEIRNYVSYYDGTGNKDTNAENDDDDDVDYEISPVTETKAKTKKSV